MSIELIVLLKLFWLDASLACVIRLKVFDLIVGARFGVEHELGGDLEELDVCVDYLRLLNILFDFI